MLDHIDFKEVKSILEPSAGDGRLAMEMLRRIRRIEMLRGYNRLHGYSYPPKYEETTEITPEEVALFDIDVIEKQNDLRHMLSGKGFRVVHDDFLKFETMKRYDLIVANPPFHQGEHHLLKILEMQEEGGAVVCLLSAKTLREPRTQARKALVNKLAQLGAEIEYYEHMFEDADRKTNEEIALIKVNIPEPERPSIILDGLRSEEQFRQYMNEEAGSLVDADPIKAIIQHYQLEVRAGVKLIQECKSLHRNLLVRTVDGKDQKPIMDLKIMGDDCWNKPVSESTNSYIRHVRDKYWRALFDMKSFAGKFTRRLKNEYLNSLASLLDYDFSQFNINELRNRMLMQLNLYIEKEIDHLFDEFSQKHSYWDETSQNVHYYNGWKTNKAWYVNKRIVIKLMGWSDYEADAEFRPSRAMEELCDVERIFNYLDGIYTDEISVEVALQEAGRTGQNRKIRTKYFEVSLFKKGTCHLHFTNEALLKKFNIFGSKRRGWLPPSYGKASYEEMTRDEKEIVDGFEGRNSYEKTLQKKDYFLPERLEHMPLLGGAVVREMQHEQSILKVGETN